MLQVLNLPLRPSMIMSSDTLLESLELDIVEELKMDLFTISLLGTTIQDSGIEERSNNCTLIYLYLYKYQLLFNI